MSAIRNVIPFPASNPSADPDELAAMYESAAGDMRYCAGQLERVAAAFKARAIPVAHDAIGRAMDALDRAVDVLSGTEGGQS